MLLASLQNVTKRYGTQQVLSGASFQVSSGRKLGIIGPNGSGKTTILRILLGQEEPSDGAAFVTKGTRVGYVPQHVEYNEDDTVIDCVLQEHRRLTDRLRETEERLAQTPNGETRKALRAYEHARDDYDRIDGDHFPKRARAMLDALGLEDRSEQTIRTLSGGEKNVLALTKALLARPDLLVLDEPANHLDYLGVAWLEDFLSKFRGAVLVVSHNRYLLDRVADGILELDKGRVQYYAGGYSAYRTTRLRQLIAQQADYMANQKRLEGLEKMVRRLADKARNRADPAMGKQLRARRAQLEREKAQAVDRPTLGPSSISADFSTEATRANIALQVRDYEKSFGDLTLFEGAELDVSCGERVALVGANGSGKTTLLRDIVAHGDWENEMIRVGPSLSMGYCAQEQELLRSDHTIFDEMLDTARITRGEASTILARFLFGEETWSKKVKDLSGGERNRLQLARLMILRPNFLILDEPTNHLDIPAREAVEEALTEFEGTILVVSHDRYFLDKVVTRVVEVKDRRLINYPGNFTDFWYARQEIMAKTSGRVASRRKQREGPKPKKTNQKALDAMEKRIQEMEKEKLEIERRIADAFSRRDQREGHRAARQLEQLQKQLDQLYEKWFAASS